MLNEITTIKAVDIIAAAKEGESITIIINGEYYDFTTEGADDLEKAFIEGVKFAAAVIEDNRARRNFTFNHDGKALKRDIYANRARNEETRYFIKFLEYIMKDYRGTAYPWYEDFKNGKLWKL